MMRGSIALILILFFPSFALGASVSLSWNPPAFSCDGSTLDDLAGYVVMWGLNSGGPYPNLHNVDDPLATSATINVGSVENVTLHFVAVSVDSSGNRSDDVGGCGPSNETILYFGAVSPSPPTGLAGAIN